MILRKTPLKVYSKLKLDSSYQIDKKLRHFEIYYNRNSVGIDVVTQAVENELKGSGQLLGYRSMHKKIRQEYGLNVTRDKV